MFGYNGSDDKNFRISDEGSHQLVSQLLRLGYFHDHVSSDSDHDDLNAFRKWKPSHDESNNESKFSWDGNSEVMKTNDRNTDQPIRYYTQQGLINKFMQVLDNPTHKGRASIQELCCELDVDYDAIFLSTYTRSKLTSSSIWRYIPESITVLEQGGDLEIVSKHYWNNMAKTVATLVEENGSLRVVDLLSNNNYEITYVPLEVFMEKVVDILPSTES